MAELGELVSCDRIFARIEENLSSYANNGQLDLGKFYSEVKWFISQMGLAVFEQRDGVINLEDHKAELPCNFYLLDSAWLCDQNPIPIESSNFQGKYVFYTTKDCETIHQPAPCLPTLGIPQYLVTSCNQGNIVEKVTLKEFVSGSETSLTWRNPILLKLNNHRSVGKICTKKCQNLFSQSPYDISIHKQGGSFYMSSNLKHAVIYIKYWIYPIDEVTQLPLIPDNPLVEKALESHLTKYFLENLYLNGDDTQLENKIKYWNQKAQTDLMDCRTLSKMPSFQTMVNYTKTVRKRWDSYELQNIHW